MITMERERRFLLDPIKVLGWSSVLFSAGIATIMAVGSYSIDKNPLNQENIGSIRDSPYFSNSDRPYEFSEGRD